MSIKSAKQYKSLPEIKGAMILCVLATKALVGKGLDGYKEDELNKKDGFPNLLLSYNWMATRDYNLVLIFFAMCNYAATKDADFKTFLQGHVATANNVFNYMVKPKDQNSSKYVVDASKLKTELDKKDGILDKLLDTIYDGFTYDPKIKLKEGEQIKDEDEKKRKERLDAAIKKVRDEIVKRMGKITNWIINGPDVLAAYNKLCEVWGIKLSDAAHTAIDNATGGDGDTTVISDPAGPSDKKEVKEVKLSEYEAERAGELKELIKDSGVNLQDSRYGTITEEFIDDVQELRKHINEGKYYSPSGKLKEKENSLTYPISYYTCIAQDILNFEGLKSDNGTIVPHFGKDTPDRPKLYTYLEESGFIKFLNKYGKSSQALRDELNRLKEQVKYDPVMRSIAEYLTGGSALGLFDYGPQFIDHMQKVLKELEVTKITLATNTGVMSLLPDLQKYRQGPKELLHKVEDSILKIEDEATRKGVASMLATRYNLGKLPPDYTKIPGFEQLLH